MDDAMEGRMRIGIGLPAAVPCADMTTLGHWAPAASAGLDAVGVTTVWSTTTSSRWWR